MAQIIKTQNNFTTGAISPGVSARNDLEKYSAGCAQLVNAVVRPHGGISKRPGTSYIETLPGDSLLIPFVYSVEQTYTLCFTSQNGGVYLRVYCDGGAVLMSNGQTFSKLTPYAPSDVPRIKFAQTADTLFLVHPAYAVHKLVRYDHADWRIEQVVFAPPLNPPTDLKAVANGFEGDSAKTSVMYKVAAVNSKEQESIPSEEVEVEVLSTWTEGATVSLSWSPVSDAVRYEVYKNARGYYGWIGSAESTTFKDDYIEPDDTTGPKEHRNPFGKPGAFNFSGFSLDSKTSTATQVSFTGAHINSQGIEGVSSTVTGYVESNSTEGHRLSIDWLFANDYPSARVVFTYPEFYGSSGSSTAKVSKQLIFNRIKQPEISYTFESVKIGSTSYKLYDSFETAVAGESNHYIMKLKGDLQLTSSDGFATVNFHNAKGFSKFFALPKVIGNYASNPPKLVVNIKILSGFPAQLASGVSLDRMKLHVKIIQRWDTDNETPGDGLDTAVNADISEGGTFTWSLTPLITTTFISDGGNIQTKAFITYGTEAGAFYDKITANPGVVGIYQQRLVLGRTDAEPQTLWFSEIGAFDSFAVATPLRDDSAITVTVDSKQMNEIRHFIPLRDMLMLTSGAEFKITSGKSDGMITPTSVAFPIQGYWGSSDVPPIVTGTCILFIQNSGKHVRDLKYTLQEDGYSGDDLTILAEHLIDSEIVDWAYQQSPYSVIWVVLKSGKLLTLTYMKEQNVWAWSEHESSGGKFKSVCCIREGAEDNVYFVVERNGVYMIEFQERWDYGSDVKDAFFVDCGLQYSGDSTNKLTGLTHLKGQKITALADGSVYRDITVADDGTFQIPVKASKVTAGLPYSMTLETLDPVINKDNGPAVVDKKNIVKVVTNLRESLALSVGTSEENLVTMKIPQIKKWGEPPELYSGKITTILPGQHREEATLVFRQDDPVPCTILSVSTYITVG